VAYLHGKSLRRAEALIAVAAPGFREELMAYAIDSKLVSGVRARDPVLFEPGGGCAESKMEFSGNIHGIHCHQPAGTDHANLH